MVNEHICAVGLSAEALRRRAVLATVGHDPGRYSGEDPTVSVSGTATVLVSLSSEDAQARTWVDLRRAGYEVRQVWNGAPGVVVSGWDRERLRVRIERLTRELAHQETHQVDAATQALGVVVAELDLDRDPDQARAALYAHLRAVADDPDRGIPRWIYPRAISAMEADAAMSTPGAPCTHEYSGVYTHSTGTRLTGIAALEDAAEQLDAARWTIITAVAAEYQPALGASHPSEGLADAVAAATDDIHRVANRAVRGLPIQAALHDAREVHAHYRQLCHHPAVDAAHHSGRVDADTTQTGDAQTQALEDPGPEGPHDEGPHDEGLAPHDDELVCPGCTEPVADEPPTTHRPGEAPLDWSHRDGTPLCGQPDGVGAVVEPLPPEPAAGQFHHHIARIRRGLEHHAEQHHGEDHTPHDRAGQLARWHHDDHTTSTERAGVEHTDEYGTQE